MHRFPCQSSLLISCRSSPFVVGQPAQKIIRIRLCHALHHLPYYDVSLPAAVLEIIQENLASSTPNGLATNIRKEYPQVTAAQIHRAWSTLSEVLWKRNPSDPIQSAIELLDSFDDVDRLELINVPMGVEIIAFAATRNIAALKGDIIELAMDGTCELANWAPKKLKY